MTVELSPEMQVKRELTRLTNRVNALEEYAARLEREIVMLKGNLDNGLGRYPKTLKS